MFDVRLALCDIAHQLRTCRTRDGLTLQQLASRSGVTASTIHKIEAQQMVPTVGVLLKIVRGLGCRPEELLRDHGSEQTGPGGPAPAQGSGSGGETPSFDPGTGVWRVDFARGERLAPIQLERGQRAVLVLERGQGEFGSHSRRVRLGAGEWVEVREEHFAFSSESGDPAVVLLIVAPAGRLASVLGASSPTPGPSSDPQQPRL